jgi:hypothetical protein
MTPAWVAAPEFLAAEERRLVASLRSIASDPLRARVIGISQELARIVAEPRCPEAQADGVPCAAATTDCEDCRGVEILLSAIELLIRN